ncbi:ATP-dependent DNA helicase Rep (plasmid) [Piscirickettsia salmonis]|uniref:AAA family ATPase n=1 Tax=Piscirickettsia salmonis TaxID=1238 RepID=UPI0012B776F1|nr:AAA family ATPase [Piscirickettsia salmonis]QGP51345.1 ATP-dependent DNA helicase Rep [Piscirickettsia salmonis]QGP52082.1 ATP-dependent DNA helicase Rep [Piscirickettsia salmonis]
MTFQLLYYNDLDSSGVNKKYKKVLDQLESGDFKSAEVKKLKPTNYLRAKIDDSHRLLFQPVKADNKTSLLILEVIKNHDYNKSRFLKGAPVSEASIQSEETRPTMTINQSSKNQTVHVLDKFIMFDECQSDILQYPLPLIVIGSAGSGKTSVTLEKMKSLEGNILYTSLSNFLVHNTRRVYFSNNYDNDKQNINFLSFSELLETIKVPRGHEIDIQKFLLWFNKQQINQKSINSGRKLFEEFRGVITGSNPQAQYMSESEYLKLGIKQSIYLPEDRQAVYKLFTKYLDHLKNNHLYDSNIISHEYSNITTQCYDAIVVDEVQDFTNSQLSLILKTLAKKGQFLLCGDANQIVHPNFFSWSKLKSLFYQGDDLETKNITRILTKNYRNTPQVTELANRVLRLKNHRLGSVDKESHNLIESSSSVEGDVSCLKIDPKLLKELNNKTSQSTHYAIIVLDDDSKKEAQKAFQTPLIFTVQEAKGLEYENVILYDFISKESGYLELSQGVDSSYLKDDFKFSRLKEKTDKSLEIYKFYINALFVAITRAIKNVYLIEPDPKHKFIRLLDINEIKDLKLQSEKSSKEEWQREANKLALQGKKEQAQAIEEKILHRKEVPWKVLDQKAIESLKIKVFQSKEANKKEKIRLLNYAIVYNDNKTIEKLQQLGLGAAHLKKSFSTIENEYFRNYTFNNPNQVMHLVDMYGTQHKNEYNFTPFMCAAFTGNISIAQELINLDVPLDDTDNMHRTAFRIAISRALHDDKYTKKNFRQIFSLLQPDSLSIQHHEQLIKIDQIKAEFFLFQFLIVAVTKLYFESKLKLQQPSFTAAQIEKHMVDMPNKLWPVYRKKRAYISSLLSRNEINSDYTTNRKLFVRVKRGYYQINPELMIKEKSEWVTLDAIINIEP